MNLDNLLATVSFGLCLVFFPACNPGLIESGQMGGDQGQGLQTSSIDPIMGSYCDPNEEDRCSDTDSFRYFSCQFDSFRNAYVWSNHPCIDRERSCSEDGAACRGYNQGCQQIQGGWDCFFGNMLFCENSEFKGWYRCARGCIHDGYGIPWCDYRKETFRQLSGYTVSEGGADGLSSTIYVQRDYEVEAVQIGLNINTDGNFWLDGMSCVTISLTHGDKTFEFSNNGEPWVVGGEESVSDYTNLNYRYEFKNDSSAGYWTLTLKNNGLIEGCDPRMFIWELTLLSE